MLFYGDEYGIIWEHLLKENGANAAVQQKGTLHEGVPGEEGSEKPSNLLFIHSLLVCEAPNETKNKGKTAGNNAYRLFEWE